MSTEFDFRKAWFHLAKAGYDALEPATKALIARTVKACEDQRQNSKLGMDWPTDESIKHDMFELSRDELAKSIACVYFYGHWFDPGYLRDQRALLQCCRDEERSNEQLSCAEWLLRRDGGYWKYDLLAKQAWIERFPGADWKAIANVEGACDNFKFKKHVKGTDMDDEELAAKYTPLLDSLLIVKRVDRVNYRPHPFCIGPQHFPKDGGIYIDVHQAPCAYRDAARVRCNLSYEDHVSDHVMFLQLKRDCLKSELLAVIKPVEDEMKKDKIDGFVFVESESKYRVTDATKEGDDDKNT